MKPWTNKIFTLSLLISILWTMNGVSQTTYDSRLVSTDKELNFAFTEKMGIKADNGVIYFVEKNGQTLTAYENNKIKWATDILKSCPNPIVGKPEIRSIKLEIDKIEVTFGKHDFASVSIIDGKVRCLGAD